MAPVHLQLGKLDNELVNRLLELGDPGLLLLLGVGEHGVRFGDIDNLKDIPDFLRVLEIPDPGRAQVDPSLVLAGGGAHLLAVDKTVIEHKKPSLLNGPPRDLVQVTVKHVTPGGFHNILPKHGEKSEGAIVHIGELSQGDKAYGHLDAAKEALNFKHSLRVLGILHAVVDLVGHIHDGTEGLGNSGMVLVLGGSELEGRFQQHLVSRNTLDRKQQVGDDVETLQLGLHVDLVKKEAKLWVLLLAKLQSVHGIIIVVQIDDVEFEKGGLE